MKNIYIFLFLGIAYCAISMKEADAGCFPAYFLETFPATGSLLYSKKISFTFIGNGGSQQVTGGYVRIYRKSDNLLVESIRITDYYPVGSTGLTGGKFEFPITSLLECHVAYYILIDPNSFQCLEFRFDYIRDVHGQIFEWNFTTAPTPITFHSGDPAYFCGGGTTSLSVNEAHAYLWSNGDTTQTISVNSTDIYSATLTYINGCQATDSTSIPSLSPDYIPICFVTVDSLSQYNQIIWTRPLLSPVDSFIVYREISTDDYRRIGAVPYQGALSIFTDTVRTKYFPNTGNPNAGTYRYKLQIVDTCGYSSELSPYHNTIFISNMNGTFTWPQLYTIEGGANPVNSYLLMRDDSSTGNWHAINSVSGTQFTVTDPAYSIYKDIAKWRVETLWDIVCNISKDISTTPVTVSRSNMTSKKNLGICDETFSDLISLYPNPTNGKFTFDIGNSAGQRISIRIYNGRGEIILKLTPGSSQPIVDLSGYPAGIYLVQVQKGERKYNAKLVLQKE